MGVYIVFVNAGAIELPLDHSIATRGCGANVQETDHGDGEGER